MSKAEQSQKARVAQLLSLYLFLASILFLGACTDRGKPVIAIEGETMGTYYHIKVVDAPVSVDAVGLREITEQALADINSMMSTYIPDSELMQLNREPTNVWVKVSDPLYSVLKTSERISRLSDGAFDITVAPLVNLWGFGPHRSSEVPSDEAINDALFNIGFQFVELDENSPQVRRLKDVKLDLSGVAKGYGADFLAEIYRDHQLQNFMIEIGGELRISGYNPNGKPWRIGIESPTLAQTGAVQAIEVANAGMATSGDYRNYYEVDGQRVSHTIDPATGRPITHSLASVTVIADTAADADALATAFNVMGAEKGRALAEQEGIAVYFIEHKNGGFVSDYSGAFEHYLRD